ncbi:MAG: D-alanyl-D-alanine dipeptidase, partial [Chlamydiae bacterium]|nr:D-alanyl-D-alanine dipeptidase [Chlamydiota bacterium]
MIKKDIYLLLEEKLFGYLDYIEVSVKSCEEALLPIPTTANLKTRPIDEDMLPFTGNQIFVRQTVLEKLSQASELLASQDPTMELEVVYGYRTKEIQKKLFEKCQSKLKQQFSGTELLEAAHKYIAHPEV